MIVQILIIFFILLISYQAFLAMRQFKEGFQENTPELQYENYDTSDPNNYSAAMILSQKNAGNIEYLKQQIESLLGLKKQVTDIETNIQGLNDQVISLSQQQQEAATQLVGSEPIEPTGL